MTKTIQCKPIDLSSLSSTELETYKPLIVPTASLILAEPTTADSFLISIEARINDELIGLIISQFYVDDRTAQLYSILVKEEFRKKGVGFFLFQSLQTLLIENYRCRALGFEYEMDDSSAIALEKIVAKLDWSPPKLYLMRCYFTADSFNPEWYQKQIQYHFSKEIKVFNWKRLTPFERKRLLFEAEQGMFPPALSPFQKENKIDYLNSLGLRYRNKVIGWCITHRILPDTIRYSILYVNKEFYLRGYAIPLLARSIRLQKKQSNLAPQAVFEINFKESERTWWTFVNKRLAPYSDKVEKMKWAMKVF